LYVRWMRLKIAHRLVVLLLRNMSVGVKSRCLKGQIWKKWVRIFRVTDLRPRVQIYVHSTRLEKLHNFASEGWRLIDGLLLLRPQNHEKKAQGVRLRLFEGGLSDFKVGIFGKISDFPTLWSCSFFSPTRFRFVIIFWRWHPLGHAVISDFVVVFFPLLHLNRHHNNATSHLLWRQAFVSTKHKQIIAAPSVPSTFLLFAPTTILSAPRTFGSPSTESEDEDEEELRNIFVSGLKHGDVIMLLTGIGPRCKQAG
jgi:hypothetical protein